MKQAGGPVAGRLRRPSWRDPRLLIGVLLIAMAVAGVGYTVNVADATEPYFAARGTLTPGEALSESNVVIVHVRVDGSRYVSAVGAPPFGSVVARVVADGELLPASAVVAGDSLDVRVIAVPTSLPLARDVVPGSEVDVWLASSAADAPSTEMIVSDAIVAEVDTDAGGFSSGSSSTVHLTVPAASVEALLAAIASGGDIAIVGPAS